MEKICSCQVLKEKARHFVSLAVDTEREGWGVGGGRAKTGRGAEGTSCCLNYHKSKKNSAMYKNPQ